MDAKGKQKGSQDRKTRLGEALRQNLAKRKAQARSRRSGGPDSRAEGLPAANTGRKA